MGKKALEAQLFSSKLLPDFFAKKMLRNMGRFLDVILCHPMSHVPPLLMSSLFWLLFNSWCWSRFRETLATGRYHVDIAGVHMVYCYMLVGRKLDIILYIVGYYDVIVKYYWTIQDPMVSHQVLHDTCNMLYDICGRNRLGHDGPSLKTKVCQHDKYSLSCLLVNTWLGGFLKWWVSPTNPWVFLLKIISTWGVKWGYSTTI